MLGRVLHDLFLGGDEFLEEIEILNVLLGDSLGRRRVEGNLVFLHDVLDEVDVVRDLKVHYFLSQVIFDLGKVEHVYSGPVVLGEDLEEVGFEVLFICIEVGLELGLYLPNRVHVILLHDLQEGFEDPQQGSLLVVHQREGHSVLLFLLSFDFHERKVSVLLRKLLFYEGSFGRRFLSIYFFGLARYALLFLLDFLFLLGDFEVEQGSFRGKELLGRKQGLRL